MKPKLVLLNGPLGIGKTTLAKRYAEEHPLSLFLDIDDVWAMISHWREKKEVSAPLSKQMALEMARINLTAGYDVVVPQIIQSNELADNFAKLASKCGANFYEILLSVEKDEAIRRFILRGKAGGHESGFRPGGIIDKGGREKKLAEMYDNMTDVANTKPEIIRIEPILGDIDSTYAEIIKSLAD
ncbi:MAG TPA: AAA family ATPase [Candidatus Saccharimonadales bacterium]|jgi:predicted kinase|nr:AAA family ATPase [Candidatus Saccharimonadales bacterium]